MPRKLVTLIALFSTASIVWAQQERRWRVLPQAESHAVAKYFLNSKTDRVTGSWVPADTDVAALEADLGSLEQMKLPDRSYDSQIEHPGQYFRQYVGILHGTRKLIFVNAFCDAVPPKDWSQELMVIMDGGSCVWQALYDTGEHRFVWLSINGRA